MPQSVVEVINVIILNVNGCIRCESVCNVCNIGSIIIVSIELKVSHCIVVLDQYKVINT